ncbi:MAG: hypothetical protein B7Z70_11455 [Acidithiobacillus ferrivorans]|uniref:Uncharacterized protein n=1 Tax=Acidithiobacillus ferrivorans TaxID=160808 RepID=A0A257SNV5_9PROT|nr:MAG: hypothetical protein B7Z70_11455 [Acidithiobacillus ferrivorans]
MRSGISPLLLQQRFLERFARRTIIMHGGFAPGWLAELLKEPGGGGHFRLDLRIPPGTPPSPIEWVMHRFVLPLDLPLPCILRVDEDAIYLRHLLHGEMVGHPSEIPWMLDSIRERHHARLEAVAGGYQSFAGMPRAENAIEYDFTQF